VGIYLPCNMHSECDARSEHVTDCHKIHVCQVISRSSTVSVCARTLKKNLKQTHISFQGQQCIKTWAYRHCKRDHHLHTKRRPDKASILLVYNNTSLGNKFPAYWDNVMVLSAKVKIYKKNVTSWTFQPLKMSSLRCLKTSGTNFPLM
jgi:hypothetical protein